MSCGLSPTLLFYPQSSQTLSGAWLSTTDELSPSSSGGHSAQVLHTCHPEYTVNDQIHLSWLGAQSKVARKMLGNLPRPGNSGSSFSILASSQRIWHALRTDCLKLLLIPSALWFCLIRQREKSLENAFQFGFVGGFCLFIFVLLYAIIWSDFQ